MLYSNIFLISQEYVWNFAILHSINFPLKHSFDRIKLWSNHNKNSHINFNLKIEENLLDIKANNRLGHLSIWGGTSSATSSVKCHHASQPTITSRVEHFCALSRQKWDRLITLPIQTLTGWRTVNQPRNRSAGIRLLSGPTGYDYTV